MILVRLSTSDDHAAAVGHSVEAAGWAAEVTGCWHGWRGRYPRVETRRAAAFMRGLTAHLPPMICWTIAEHAASETRTGCSTCARGQVGTPNDTVMTSATLLSTRSAGDKPCCSSKRPVTS